jgi:hypothetical protein
MVRHATDPHATTDDGRQITLRADEFAAKFGWKNDPEKIRLSYAATDRPQGSKAEKLD